MRPAGVIQTPFSANDIEHILQCRGERNRLGFAYQLAFVRFFNRFPAQEPLEVSQDTVHRIIQTQREAARNAIYSQLAERLSDDERRRLDALLETDEIWAASTTIFSGRWRGMRASARSTGCGV
jgi:hypothetical protein